MKRLFTMVLCACLACPAAVFAEGAGSADTVYINGNIYTMAERAFHATAMAVSGQMLVYVGDDEGAQAYIGSETQVVDLAGQTVIPGIVESHLHFTGIGEALTRLDAFWKPKEDILALVAAEAARLNPGEWITGGGWNQEVWPGEQFPTREDLDAVAPDNPVMLSRTCGHMIWVNSLALSLAGVTAETEDPVGGEYLRNDAGEPLGVITDTAMYSIYELVPPLSEARTLESMRLAQDLLFSYGITSAADAGTGMATMNLLHSLYASGDLSIRLYEMVSENDAEAFYAQGPQTGLYDGRLDIRCVKFMADGSLGARSAWMLDEYSDRAGHVGNGRYTDDELYALYAAATDAGFQVATHAISDAANRQAIDAWERVTEEVPAGDYRPRIEHFQVANLDDFQRVADLGMIASMQFVHATSDLNMAEDRVGSERILGAYAWRRVLNTGAIIANGSDAPVENVNPYHGLYAAVSRATTGQGLPRGGWYPAEALTRYEALRAFTLHAAYAEFAEAQKGSLEAGKYADFAVIDRDYMTCAVDEIKDIQAVMTVVGGAVVFTR